MYVIFPFYFFLSIYLSTISYVLSLVLQYLPPHRAVFEYRGAVFPGVPGVPLGHGGNHPRYASYVEVLGNISIMSFIRISDVFISNVAQDLVRNR
jgi:hypothetical protein